MMGRLRPGVSLAQAQAALAGPFAQWVAPTATNDRERANLPVLRLEEGAGGLDSLRRQYSKPLYVLLAMVGLILAIACANTANLLLARASARKREMAVRLSIGAGRFRVVRQLLTESVLLASLSGALGILIAVAGIRVLTRLLANGQEGFTLHAELNWHVLAVTLGLSLLCGVLFGLAPAMQLARPALMPALKDTIRHRARGARAPRHPAPERDAGARGGADRHLAAVAGRGGPVRADALESPIHPARVQSRQRAAVRAECPAGRIPGGQGRRLLRRSAAAPERDSRRARTRRCRMPRSSGPAGRTRSPSTACRRAGTASCRPGPGFFTTMQIPMLRGREIEERDRQGTLPVAVVSDLFARTYFGDENPVGRRIKVGGSRVPLDLEIVGVAATARYGGLKGSIPPVVYVPYAQVPSSQLQQMTFALRTDGDPLRYVAPSARSCARPTRACR